jgi:beta-lactam-binding protein with PASTA domain
VVSQGSESVFVPNVYSFTQSKATAMLQDLDLVVIVKKIGTRAVKTVTDISPQVGTKVTRGSSVTITVG